MSTVTTGPVNVRERPAGPVIAQLDANVGVTELATTTVDAVLNGVSYTWQGVRLADNTLGWCANRFLSSYVPPTPPSVRRIGIHALQDARNAVQAFYAKLPQGYAFPSATVINDAGLASWLANGRCDRVVFRYVTGNSAIDNPVISATATIADGHDWTARKITSWAGFGDLLQYPGAIRLQIANEVGFTLGHSNWWTGAMQAIEEFGLHAAVGAYSVGTPESADWLQLSPMLRYAMSHGHVVALHAYCADGTAPGQLSADSADFELRFPRLYSVVTADAQPDLIISEFGGGNQGKFQGTDNWLQLVTAYRNAVQAYPYVVGVNPYTVGSLGGWQAASIDAALTDPRTVALFS